MRVLDIEYRPYVTDAPVRWSVTARASLPCEVPHAHLITPRRPPPPIEAEDRPRPKPYLWWKGDEKLSPKWVTPSGALEVAKRRDGGDGVYRCAMRHYGGLIMGYPVHLKFASMEKQFTSNPENVTARRGQPVALSCVISSAPAAELLWLRNEEALPDGDRYHTLSSQLLITDVTSADAGEYRCIATNPQLNKTRTSRSGHLQVTVHAEDQEPSFLPVYVEQNIAVARGSRVILPCPVTGWPRPKLIWEQSLPGGKTAELEVTDEVFVIHSLEYDQEGTYTCSVVGHSKLTKTFNVTITEPPEITIPPAGKEVLRASTVRFNCTASGRPEPNISWYKNWTLLTMAGRINLRKSADGQRNELVISGVTSDDAGVYQCFAQNVAGVASAWAILNVTGEDAAAPTNVRCWPISDRKVAVKWDSPTVGEVIAYTVHGTLQSKTGLNVPAKPVTDTEENITVDASLTPYRFQIRSYMHPKSPSKNVASDPSAAAVCQGQGVPIKMAKLEDGKILVSWKQFYEDNPGVVQWILQHRLQDTSDERNITLDGSVYNYTLPASSNGPQQIRVLGSRSLKWLRQDLSLVPWVSTANAGRDLEAGEVTAVPRDIGLIHIGRRNFTVTWRCYEAEASDEVYVYMVCARMVDGNDKCQESKRNSATFEGLQPNTVYEVRVQARIPNRALGGPFSPPYTVTTLAEGPQRFKDLKGVFINSTTLHVSWNGPPGKYTVRYSTRLWLPVEQWTSVQTDSNNVLIHDVEPADKTYVMVIGYNPPEHSQVETITPGKEEVHYKYTRDGILVWWTGQRPGAHVIRYEQNITRPLEQWRSIVVPQSSIELTDLNPDLPTYVMVSSSKGSLGEVLNIAPRPQQDDNSAWYLAVGIPCGLFVLCLLAVAAVCLWRRRKMARSPRQRRRNASPNDGNAEEGAEMKNVGGRLANGGGSKDAGEPLLNGHVHITENPTLKPQNGKMKKGRRCETAFDVSRFEDPNTTLETVLDADTSASTTYNLLDTSRKLELDLSRSSRDISTNNSFNKLPDDNMNSELTRSTGSEFDNSKIPPTLQPNG